MNDCRFRLNASAAGRITTALRQSFRWQCPEHFNFGFDVVDRWAEAFPDHTGDLLGGPSGEKTRSPCSEIADRSGRLARAVTELGLHAGDRVLVILPRVPWWETLVGLLKAGVVAIPGHDAAHSPKTWPTGSSWPARRPSSPIARGPRKSTRSAPRPPGSSTACWSPTKLGRAGTRYAELIASQAEADRSRSPRGADEPALVYFTSGTTGMPKMVLHTHASYGARPSGDGPILARPDAGRSALERLGHRLGQGRLVEPLRPLGLRGEPVRSSHAGQIPAGRRARRAWLDTRSRRCVPPRRFIAGWCSSI